MVEPEQFNPSNWGKFSGCYEFSDTCVNRDGNIEEKILKDSYCECLFKHEIDRFYDMSKKGGYHLNLNRKCAIRMGFLW